MPTAVHPTKPEPATQPSMPESTSADTPASGRTATSDALEPVARLRAGLRVHRGDELRAQARCIRIQQGPLSIRRERRAGLDEGRTEQCCGMKMPSTRPPANSHAAPPRVGALAKWTAPLEHAPAGATL